MRDVQDKSTEAAVLAGEYAREANQIHAQWADWPGGDRDAPDDARFDRAVALAGAWAGVAQAWALIESGR